MTGSIVRAASLLLSAVIVTVPAELFAGGIAVFSQGTKQMGNAYAGTAANVEDSSAVAYNPAGLMLLRGSGMSMGADMIDGQGDYQYTVNRSPADGSAVGMADRRFEGSGTVPHAYYSNRVSDNAAVGFGIYVPMELSGDYDPDWMSRYQMVRTDVAAINLNPAVAFNAFPGTSIGFGAVIQYVEAHVSSPYESRSAAAERMIQQIREDEGDAAADAAAPEIRRAMLRNYDATREVSGNDVSYAFNAGFLWAPSNGVRIGISYRSSVHHRISGDRTGRDNADSGRSITVPDTTEQVIAPKQMYLAREAKLGAERHDAVSIKLNTAINSPETVTFGLGVPLGNYWKIQAGATWTRWNEMPSQQLNYSTTDNATSGGTELGHQPMGTQTWKDSWHYGLGVSFMPNRRLTLRAGVAIDESPLRKTQGGDESGGSEDRHWFAVGSTLNLSRRVELDVAYMRIVFNQHNEPDPSEDSEQQKMGSVENVGIDVIGTQLNFRF